MLEKEIPIDDIKVSVSRIRSSKEKKEEMKRLINSIKQLGLFHPILVDEDYNLIAGFRRLEAYKELRKDNSVKFDKIRATVIPKKDRLRDLTIEFEENWARKQLGGSEVKHAQSSIMLLKDTKKEGLDYKLDTTLLEMKKVYEDIYPEAKHGGREKDDKGLFITGKSTAEKMKDQVGDTPTWIPQVTTKVAPSFATKVSQEMNLDRSTIEKRIRVGQAIEDEVYTKDEIESYQKGKISHTKMLKTSEKRKSLTNRLSESLNIEKEKAREIAKQPKQIREKILKKPLIKYNLSFTVDGIVETSKEEIVLLDVGEVITRIGKNRLYWENKQPNKITIIVERLSNENDDL